MIELRYNKDGKLEYRTRILGYIAEGISDGWNEWVVVPSEQTKSYTSGIVPKGYISGVAWVHREAVDAIEQELEKVKQERDEHKARVAQLEAEKQTLLESEMWGVNCKPSASNAEPVAWGVMLKSESPQVVVGNPSPWKHMSLYFLKRDADERRSMHGGTVFPLYTEPQPVKEWLTAEERKWVEYMSGNCVLPYAGMKCMEAILARSSPPEVVLPGPWKDAGGP